MIVPPAGTDKRRPVSAAGLFPLRRTLLCCRRMFREHAVPQVQTIVQVIEGEDDYIVVGAGSARCLLANPLSAHPRTPVPILETSRNVNLIWIHISAC